MRAAAWAVAAMCAAGCGLSRAPAPRQSEAMERSARILRQLDKLEADLHSQDAETDTFAELVQRHGEAQQMACKVTDEHVQEIHRLAAAQERKLEQKRALRKKKAVALLTARKGQS